MSSQHKNVEKKRGRPATGKGHQVNVSLSDAMIHAVDAYSEQTGVRRTEAIRKLIKLGIREYNAMVIRRTLPDDATEASD